jgi:predicted RNA binding protein YcfA (HicA-like mRNA interferase family)
VPKLPQVRPDRLRRALLRAGFVEIRQSGSHVFLRRGTVTLNIPAHEGRDIKTGTLAAILKAAGMTADQLRDLL